MEAKNRMQVSWEEKYPKTRPPLTDKYRRIYEAEYLRNRDGEGMVSSFANRLEAWMHRKIARGSVDGASTLELGAGTLNHINYEPNSQPYDIVEPFSYLYQGRSELARIRSRYHTIHDIPKEVRYQRIISIAVLEHVLDLPDTIARAGILLTKNGVFSAGIPTEGGLLWYLAWRLGTGLPFYFHHGLDYGPYMRHEHVNSAIEISDVLHYFFRDISTDRFPLSIFHASFYTYLECREPDLERCCTYLQTDRAG